MLAFDPAAYGPVFAPFLNVDRCRPLDGGSPRRDARAALESLSIEAAFAHPPAIADRSMAECCLAGVWLLHDFLAESHSISQGIDTPTGSFWHGIMHRREGDFSNAKYWFRRVGNHQVFQLLADCAASTSDAEEKEAEEKEVDASGRWLVSQGAWDPFEFVDLCQTAPPGSSIRGRCLRWQQVEWECLFDFCYRHALP